MIVIVLEKVEPFCTSHGQVSLHSLVRQFCRFVKRMCNIQFESEPKEVKTFSPQDDPTVIRSQHLSTDLSLQVHVGRDQEAQATPSHCADHTQHGGSRCAV